MWDCDIELYGWFREFDNYFNDELIDLEVEKELEDVFTERVYETTEEVIEFTSFLSAYSMTIEVADEPRVEEVRNVRNASVGNSRKGKRVAGYGPQITTGRESLAEIYVYDKEVKVVLEMPGVGKEHIKIKAYPDYIEISSNHHHRKSQVIEIPHVADINRARSTYKNGILEIVFKKKEKLNGSNNRREIRKE